MVWFVHGAQIGRLGFGIALVFEENMGKRAQGFGVERERRRMVLGESREEQ